MQDDPKYIPHKQKLSSSRTRLKRKFHSDHQWKQRNIFGGPIEIQPWSSSIGQKAQISLNGPHKSTITLVQ